MFFKPGGQRGQDKPEHMVHMAGRQTERDKQKVTDKHPRMQAERHVDAQTDRFKRCHAPIKVSYRQTDG